MTVLEIAALAANCLSLVIYRTLGFTQRLLGVKGFEMTEKINASFRGLPEKSFSSRIIFYGNCITTRKVRCLTGAPEHSKIPS